MTCPGTNQRGKRWLSLALLAALATTGCFMGDRHSSRNEKPAWATSATGRRVVFEDIDGATQASLRVRGRSVTVQDDKGIRLGRATVAASEVVVRNRYGQPVWRFTPAERRYGDAEHLRRFTARFENTPATLDVVVDIEEAILRVLTDTTASVVRLDGDVATVHLEGELAWTIQKDGRRFAVERVILSAGRFSVSDTVGVFIGSDLSPWELAASLLQPITAVDTGDDRLFQVGLFLVARRTPPTTAPLTADETNPS